MLIAQISDFHLTAGRPAYGQVHTAEALKRTVAYLNALTPKPDAVVITGDVADAGKPEAYALAVQILETLAAPFWIIPGNHDHRDRMRAAFPAHTYMTDTCTDGRICFVEDRFELRLIGLDTLTPGKHGGGVSSQELLWLEDALADGKPSVLFMHHPPFPVGIGNMDADGFDWTDDFEKTIRNAPNVLRICCGHMHRPVLRQFGGTTACIAPSVSMQLDLDLTPQAPSQFMMEPSGLALHLYEPLAGQAPELVTHFGLIPGNGHTFAGPYPFTGVVSPV